MAHLVSLDVEVVLLRVLRLELGLPVALEVSSIGEDGLGALVEGPARDEIPVTTISSVVCFVLDQTV